MAGARSSSSCSESDDIAEALSAKSSPPDYVEKISQSSEGHNRHNEEADEPAEAESDSGDSLFITQISAPEAERTRRRHRSPRSDPASPGDLEGSGSDASLSDSHEVSVKVKEKKKVRRRLPKYSFPFLSGKNGTLLPRRHNVSLHNCIMGGFFTHVRGRWLQGYRGEDDEKPSSVHMDSKYISPLSEEEEEKSEDEDIKVVERKCFLAPSKAKRQQSWSNHLKQEKKMRNGSNARRETSRGRRCKTVLVEKLKNGEKGASGENTKKCLPQGDETISLQQRAREEELCNDGDASVCEPPMRRRSLRLCQQKHKEASTTATEPQSVVLLDASETENEHDSSDLQSDTNNDSEPRVKNGKKKKEEGDHESIEEEEEEGHSWEEPEGLHAATSASQTSDELEFNERNCLENSLHDNSIARQEEEDVPDSKQKKKKRKKSAAENVSQETDVNLESGARVEDSGFSESCNVENGGKKKKKKKRKRSVEDEEQLQSRELLSDDSEIKKKKKKRKKEEKTVIAEECEEEKELNRTLNLPPVSTGQVEELGNSLENTTAHEATLESSCVKRKSLKKKNKLSFSDDAAQDKEEVEEVSFPNDAVTLDESTDMSLKKKKKKKKTTISEEVDITHAPEENEKVEGKDNTQQTKEGLEADAELVTKKKKKKKKTNSEEVDISHTPEENEKVECKDNTQQTKEVLEADAELVTKIKKKKKKKANSEEVDISHTPEENEKVECEDNTQQTKEGLKADAELVTKKKKKKKTNSGEVDISHTPEENEKVECEDNTQQTKEGLEADAELVTKKKKKKKKTNSGEVDISHAPEENKKVECEDYTQQTKEGLEADAELVTKIKIKKKKKKTNSGEVDISHTPEENKKVECEDYTQQTKEGLEADAELVTKKKKKKKKTNSGEVDISHTPEENEKVEDDTQKIKEVLEDQNAEKKKKKGKKSEIFGRNISEDSVAQSDDSVSVRKKEKKKKRTASFLAADVEENGLQTHGKQNCLDFETESAETGGNLEESTNGVRKKKKKRKRKVSEEQDGVEKDHKLHFGEPKETCQSALPETVDTGVKRKKMKKKSVDEACHVTQGSPPTATEDGNQTLSDIKEKKRTKRTHDNLLKGHSELQLQESKKKKKKERNKKSAIPNIVSSSPVLSETSVSTSKKSFLDSIMKKKQKRVK